MVTLIRSALRTRDVDSASGTRAFVPPANPRATARRGLAGLRITTTSTDLLTRETEDEGRAKAPLDAVARTIVLESHNHIDERHLRALLAHECVAVVVRGFLSPEAAAMHAAGVEAALARREETNWLVSSGATNEAAKGEMVRSEVDTLGTPLNVAMAQGASGVQSYYASSLKWTRRFRADVGAISPLDKLRLELDECHPGGCVLGRDENTHQPRSSGLVRVMRRTTSRGLIHVDEIATLSPTSGVFSGNVYLQTSLVGGDLEIWPVAARSQDELRNHAAAFALMTRSDDVSQRMLREGGVLPASPAVIKPQAGDLVLLCVQRPHAVRGPVHGPRARISAQTFIVHSGADKPLAVEA